MTILQKPRRTGDGHAGHGWYRFGHAEEAVRHTDAWEHETFQEEQARWERGDPAYARLCEEVRQTKDRGDEASLRADEAKAEWDARVATQRRANDDAQKAHHALNANPTARPRMATARNSFVPATEDTFPKKHRAVARGNARSRRSSPRAYDLRNGVQ